MAGVFWSLACAHDAPAWDRLSFLLAASGTAIVIAAPFLGAGDPLMNNYVPLLRHPVFYAGLGLFTAGITSHLLRCTVGSTYRESRERNSGRGRLRIGSRLSALVTALQCLLSWHPTCRNRSL
jgi:hypothetical protein